MVAKTWICGTTVECLYSVPTTVALSDLLCSEYVIYLCGLFGDVMLQRSEVSWHAVNSKHIQYRLLLFPITSQLE